MTEEEQHQFLQRLAYKKDNPSFGIYAYRHLSGGDDLYSVSLANLLMIDASLLTEDGKEALSYMESLCELREQSFSFERFKWKVTAFLAVQDLLSTPVFHDTTNAAILQLKYFYYESKYILTEVIVSSLNGLHIANKQLMRNFLEFNLLQCYFINRIKKEYSFQSFNEFLKTKINPGVTRLLRDAVPGDEFCKPIKKRIQIEANNLSNRYSHAYNQNESPKHDGIFHPGLSIESIYFYVHVTATLDVVLWMYYVNFPMLFKPVDIVRKFGFSPPALFVTPDVTAIIRKTMAKEDFEIFENYAANTEEVKSNLSWYDSLSNLSEEEIWQQWDKPREDGDTIEACFARMIATVRAYSQLIVETEKMKDERSDGMEDIENSVAEIYTNFSKWRKAYKFVKQ